MCVYLSDHLRYKFPADFPRNRVIYGLTEALEETDGRPLIVVEGPFKVFHLFQISIIPVSAEMRTE